MRNDELQAIIDSLQNKDIGNTTIKGVEGGIDPSLTFNEPGIELKTGETAGIVKSSLPDEPEVYTFVSEKPDYPGGQVELMIYLSRNMKYPPIAIEIFL